MCSRISLVEEGEVSEGIVEVREILHGRSGTVALPLVKVVLTGLA